MVAAIGYGSFMIRDSLAKTIPFRPGKPVWVQGHRRVFNLRTRLLKLYDVKESSNEVAILNAVPEPDKRMNALLFEVSDEEFDKLKIRERIYYAKQVKVTDFKSNEPAGTAVLFVGRKIYRGERIVSNEYLPILSYLQRCREAAYEVGDDFGKAFDDTTFLGDGRTAAEYLKKNI
jgi:hypothetical protein